MSLLKTNEIQNYNGSSLTLTASTVSTSAQLNTGGNISVTGSLNVSDDSTTRTNLGLGSIATQDSDNVTVTGGTATLGALTVSGSDSGDLVRITQTGSGNALVVEDSTNPDSTPFVVANNGDVGVGTSSLTGKLSIASGTYDSTTPLATADDIVISGNQSLGMSFITTAVGSSNQSIVFGDSDDTDIGSIKYAHSDNSMQFSTNAAEQMRIDSSGNVLVGKTSVSQSTVGTQMLAGGPTEITTNGNRGILINRKTSDGQLIAFDQDGVTEGEIIVSGTHVSLSGAHLARWSQLADNTRDESIVKGTVMSNLDQMAEWTNDGVTEDNEQLNCMKVSDVEGDINVAGVFVTWDNDDEIHTNDMIIAMTGDMVIRIAQGNTVQRGDLLMSAGDGTAKPQGDDIVRSKTIAKVTSTHVSHTYEDGSYLVPCVLMAC